MTRTEAESILKDVQLAGLMAGWTLKVRMTEEGRMFLQVHNPHGVCNVTGQASVWSGRKWMLSTYMTKSEVVQTALKAVLTALEHEAREMFFYKGETIFDGHLSVDALVRFRKEVPLDGRPGGMEG